jgi:hypothetical protein
MRAFSFARGQPLTLPGGREVKIDRPLDFSVVSDHSEYLAEVEECTDPQAALFGAPFCATMRAAAARSANCLGDPSQCGGLFSYMSQIEQPMPKRSVLCTFTPDRPAECDHAVASAWEREQMAAEAANQPCDFTAFKAYEWTAQTRGDVLHRIIVFKTGTVPARPLTYLDYPTPLSMLTALEKQCRPPDCDALSMPHNANQSRGQMWLFDPASDEPRLRAKYERLAEIHQNKGSSECLNTVDPSDAGYDPQCEFEISASDQGNLPVARPGYLRYALEKGLLAKAAAAEQPNPLQLGFVGSTDTHNATPGKVRESDFSGHFGLWNATPKQRLRVDGANWNPGGITAVWAEQNTRDSLFAALSRRETYATSGPRMVVRFYAFAGDAVDPCADPSFPDALAGAATPMGGELALPPGRRPRFVVSALKDDANLAEVNLVKASVVNGAVSEQVARVIVGGGGGVPSVCHVFDDLDFDPRVPAFYYAKVIEVPTPRWSHFDCQADDTTREYCASHPGLDVPIQERAWTSPIWHLPN